MRIKGTVTKSIQEYVKNEQGDKYQNWIDSLPKASQEIFKNSISVSDWYPVDEALIEPTLSVGRIFFADSKKAAWQLGRYSAEIGLKGVYKVFIMISTVLVGLAEYYRQCMKMLMSIFMKNTITPVWYISQNYRKTNHYWKSE